MKLLGLDTATEACSVALWIDREVVERFAVVHQQHSNHILGMVDAVLAETGLALSGLDAIAFGRGPGSFTGLRICAGVTQGLAFGADLPVVPVSSLAALAQAEEAPNVLAAIDARMGQVYFGAYQRHGDIATLTGQEQVLSPETIPLPTVGEWLGVGSGWDHYESALRARVGAGVDIRKERHPHASAIVRLGVSALTRGEALAAELAVPVYIRDDVAKKTVDR